LRLRLVISERAPPSMDFTVSPVWRVLRRMLYSWSDDIVAQTREAAFWIGKNCRKEALVIPNALRPLPSIEEARQTLIVSIGRLEIVKGFDLLLRAFARIASEFPEWDVAIIGEGPEHENLVRMRDELNLANRVKFIGQVREVETWMARAGLVVQPSRFEGFPNVVLEAMGMGAAVVSADCPAGPADLIEDGVNGSLVPVEDVDSLANRIADLMLHPGVRERFGLEALKVKQRFRQELVMTKWEACLFPGFEIHEGALDQL